MMGVRLSEREYSALEAFSSETGARSMSDVVRVAIGQLVHRPAHRNSLASSLEHASQVRELEQRVSQLTAEIELLRASRGPSAGEVVTASDESNMETEYDVSSVP